MKYSSLLHKRHTQVGTPYQLLMKIFILDIRIYTIYDIRYATYDIRHIHSTFRDTLPLGLRQLQGINFAGTMDNRLEATDYGLWTMEDPYCCLRHMKIPDNTEISTSTVTI